MNISNAGQVLIAQHTGCGDAMAIENGWHEMSKDEIRAAFIVPEWQSVESFLAQTFGGWIGTVEGKFVFPAI